MTGLVLLLYHNICAHHHNEDHHDHIEHHDNDVLEHAKVDHIFSSQTYHLDGLQALVPVLIFKPDLVFGGFPLTLYIQPVVSPDEPYPPGWVTNETILRGPPADC
ncbi:hypothetical protein DIU31_022320 [Mucilaginibacter rubeus]|nr:MULTISPECIES: hypothetical protein [Mucilaginibacter]QEM06114.1 hypothetical protein DIU31_022320 [Mucilaginibacter rubeus]QEM18694.1 hypothetical protein DIU38_022545 [Mucilaginibacter gossypii]QTE44764.1 hypothetical protein J3L19_05175 [Mucilaginibacter rubeus]QTE51362.1 hypothetical protein J3L21_05150 [Mucilaginibacter rubeus]QTE56449.1 hypothetical protein J3L23_30400 [Mucilaginibacter rubeus]